MQVVQAWAKGGLGNNGAQPRKKEEYKAGTFDEKSIETILFAIER